MLLFVRNPYYREILAGRKRFEFRAGQRYRHVRAGDTLSINGKLRVVVTAVDRLTESTPELRDCYPDSTGPFFRFHFDKIGNTPALQTASTSA